MKKRYRVLLQLLATVLCAVALTRIVPLESLREALGRGEPLPLILVFALAVPAVLARALRWLLILRAHGVAVGFGTVTRATLIGMGLNLFLPASSGDIARSYYGWKRHGNKEAMLASAVSDKVVALFTLCALGALSSLYVGQELYAWLALALALPMAVALLVPWAWPWQMFAAVVARLARRHFDPGALRDMFHMTPRTFLVSCGVSVVGWTATNLMYYFAGLAYSRATEPLFVFAVAPFINLTRMIPVTIAGLGSADGLIVYFFAQIGVANADALAASMTINVALIALPGAVGGILLLLDR